MPNRVTTQDLIIFAQVLIYTAPDSEQVIDTLIEVTQDQDNPDFLRKLSVEKLGECGVHAQKALPFLEELAQKQEERPHPFSRGLFSARIFEEQRSERPKSMNQTAEEAIKKISGVPQLPEVFPVRKIKEAGQKTNE